ncbi:unnamed protein product [Clonostachys rosea]|uniref:Transcription factor domain-containing protein n=1 Tax=Bionectria ochroleuca TaxID=29856 RepID=A0ABY6UZ05_BIOOC|nr:unnamed protein product [Clonostachys rosea]
MMRSFSLPGLHQELPFSTAAPDKDHETTSHDPIQKYQEPWASDVLIRHVDVELIIPCPANSVNYLLESFPILFNLRSQYCATRPRTIEVSSLYSEFLEINSLKFSLIYLGARMYAAQLGSSKGKLPPGSCLQYKVAAIENIRQAIEGCTVVSEADILAVLFMTMSYNKHLDNHSEWNAHMDGIKKMVSLRGGWDNGKYGELIRDLYTWCMEHGTSSSLCAGFAPDI